MKVTAVIEKFEPVVQPPPEFKGVTLTLSPKEALFLRRIMGHSGRDSLRELWKIGPTCCIPKCLEKVKFEEVDDVHQHIYDAIGNIFREIPDDAVIKDDSF